MWDSRIKSINCHSGTKTQRNNMRVVGNKNNRSPTFWMKYSNMFLITRKQRNNLERQVGILNEVLAEQGGILRKYQLESDEKAMAALIRTYENKEAVMNRNIAHQQEIIARLKNHIEKQENQVSLLE